MEDNNLSMEEVGPWVHDKHERLRRYIDISSKVRAKFIAAGKAGATYTDLYCGHGCARRRDNREIVDGSAIVAVLAARTSRHAFSEIHIGDKDLTAVHATAARLRSMGITAETLHIHAGVAEATAKTVATQLNPHGLHFIFLDPYSLGDLPISVLAAFANLKRPDILIHVSAMDLQRNLEQAIDANEGHQFDTFAPGWRNAVDTKQAPHAVRQAIRQYWIKLAREMDLKVFENQFTLIKGPRNQPLYWLAFASKSDKASEFWEKIRNIEPQRGFNY